MLFPCPQPLHVLQSPRSLMMMIITMKRKKKKMRKKEKEKEKEKVWYRVHALMLRRVDAELLSKTTRANIPTSTSTIDIITNTREAGTSMSRQRN